MATNAALANLLVHIGVADDTGDGARRIESSIGRMGDRIRTSAAAIGAGIGAGLAAGIGQAIENEAAGDKLAAQLGATGDRAAELGRVQGDVYAAGWGDSLGTVGEAIKGVQQNIGDLGEGAEGGLEGLATKALAVADTFDQDLGMTTAAVGQLMRTGLASSADEAFDIITTGLQSSADKSGDFLETLNEYSTQWRRVGLDAQTATGLLAQGLTAGARDADQVADAIGQFGERALAGGTAVEEAFTSIGLDAGEMATEIGKGGDSAKGALQKTMDALRGTSDEQTKLNVAAALFGDPGNVLGAALFALDPATAAASAGMDNVAGATDRMTETVSSNPAAAFETFKRTAMQRLGELGADMINFAMQHQGALQPLAIAIGAIAAAILVVRAGMAAWTAAQVAWRVATTIGTAAQWAFNAAMSANPIVLVTLLVAGLVAGIVLLYKNSETARKIIDAAFGGIQRAVSAVFNWTKQNWPLILAILTGPFGIAVLTISRHWDDIKGAGVAVYNWIKGLPGDVTSALSGVGSAISAPFRSGFNSVARYWNSTIGGKGFDIPSWVPFGVGGKSFRFPTMPQLAVGGFVTSTGVALIHAGETVTPAGTAPLPAGARGGGAGTVLELRSSGRDVDDLLIDILRRAIRNRGGDVDLVLGGR